MTWTKLSDDWTDRADLARLSFEDRWHYLAMIQLCSRSNTVTGVLRLIDARRASDHPEPAQALTRLAEAGLLEALRTDIRIIQIDDHIPPPSVRQKAEADKMRKRRERAHKADDHTLCRPDHCEHVEGRTPRETVATPSVPASPLPVTSDVTRDFVRDPGTGQDGPGTNGVPQNVNPDTGEITEALFTDWPTVRIPKDPEFCDHRMTAGTSCVRCPGEIAQARVAA